MTGQKPKLPNGFAWGAGGSPDIVRRVDDQRYTVRVSGDAIVVVDGRKVYGVNSSIALALLDHHGLNTTAQEERSLFESRNEQVERMILEAGKLREQMARLQAERDELLAKLDAHENATVYYSIGGDGHIHTHSSEVDAKADAEAAIEVERELASRDNEWHDEVDSVEYGRLIPIAKAVEIDADNDGCDYALRPVKGPKS